MLVLLICSAELHGFLWPIRDIREPCKIMLAHHVHIGVVVLQQQNQEEPANLSFRLPEEAAAGHHKASTRFPKISVPLRQQQALQEPLCLRQKYLRQSCGCREDCAADARCVPHIEG